LNLRTISYKENNLKRKYKKAQYTSIKQNIRNSVMFRKVPNHKILLQWLQKTVTWSKVSQPPVNVDELLCMH